MPRQAIFGDGLDQSRSEEGQREQHCGRSNGALLPLSNIRDVENPPGDKIVEPASRLSDAGKKLSLGVRPGCSRIEMNPLDRRDEFAADTRGRLLPGDDDRSFSNDCHGLSRECDFDRTVSDNDALDGSLDQPTAFGRQRHGGGWSGRHSI